ncbi:nuclear transport factor 2 family protein [Actinomadura coerulea]|uniref:nuclear transport factor 2 family protein n=1 Tax=Actinomadura coerulea TaxID=46159 RepID=UPI003432F8B8
MPATPRDLFQQMRQRWLDHPASFIGDLLTDDAVVETPFAPPGHPTRFEGRQRFLDFAAPQRAALPLRFDDCRTIAVHDTLDPDTIVVEYELTGTNTKTAEQSTAAFIAVLTARDGKVARWREYQNTLAIMQALT